MTVVFHLESLVIRSSRVVHHHDESAVQVATHRLGIELLRRVSARLAHLLAILVHVSISELLHGLAQRQAEHAIDGRQHLRLATGNGGRFLLVGHHLAQLQSEFAQLRTHHTLHATGVVGTIGLRLQALRHQSVLAGQVSHAAERTSIVDGMVEEELHAQVVDGLLCTVDDALKHQVGLLQLVVEEQIVVRELHSQRVLVLLGKVGTQHVQSREHPAAPTRLLVVDALFGRLNAEVSVEVTLIGEVLGQVVYRELRNGIEKSLLLWGGSLRLLHLLKHLLRDSPIGFLCRSRQRCQHAQC